MKSSGGGSLLMPIKSPRASTRKATIRQRPSRQ